MRRPSRFSITIALLGLTSAIVTAQCVTPTISASRVRGAVFDPTGQPLPNSEVILKQDGKVIASVRTDDAGGFFIPVNAGKYDLLVKGPIGFEPLGERIDVATDSLRAIKPTHLWVILTLPSAQLDSCDGLVTTSHRKFQKAIQKESATRN